MTVEMGGAIGKKTLADAIGGPIGSTVNALPGASVTGEVVLGEGGVNGLQVGIGTGIGATMDVDMSAKPLIYEKEIPR